MKKLFTLFCLVFVAPLFAEPVMYVCERPSWGDDEGCGPNGTRYTYGFLIDSEDFSRDLVGSRSGEQSRAYTFAEARGCDLSRTRGKEGKYQLITEGYLFGLGRSGRDVELHTDSMQAKVLGVSVKHSPYMTCTEFRGDEIQASPNQTLTGYWWPTHQAQRPASPTRNVNSDRHRQ